MLTKEERARVVNEIAIFLRESERFAEQDLVNKYALEGVDRALVWEAKELVRREDGIDFGPIRGWPGNYERKSWEQIEQRAHRQRAKGSRAHRRAEARLRLAAQLAPTDAQQRLSEAADRLALRAAMKAAKG